ncbi:lysophospholipid acyltransferase family protein [Thiobacter aerophilum]|uniref:Lysophospholipid acyltransferase family protein n=1 Tax=Thiobacter aerophilum TaxID=3121275 RepID=A0ABV0EIV7_9BURK
MAVLMRLAARMPLWAAHAVGALLGWLVYAASPSYRRRFRDHLAASRLAPDEAALRRLRRAAIAHAGKAMMELAVIWGRPLPEVVAWVRCEGWQYVEAALAEGRGLILLTPHLGCFEVAALYAAQRIPLTVLYRPPKLRWLASPMAKGRARGGMKLAPTDVTGVRRLFAALKRGEAVGLLPDQVPGAGEGVWAPFFGRPAYTMTLVSKLAVKTGAPVLLAVARRLPRGRGYHLSLRPLPFPFTGEKVQDAGLVNAAIESLVRECPEQYLWSYNRYKRPRGARPA